jgi:hypothetical protein
MSEKQAAGRRKKSRLERWKSAQPGWLHPFSRDHSRQSSRAPSPVPSKGKADDAPAIAGASSSTLGIRPGVNRDAQLVASANATIPAIELDDEEDVELGTATDGSQDQENENTELGTNTDTADSAQENDMWKIAEAQMRQDEKKKKLLDAYYNILRIKLREDLEPAGTPERQKQISAFIVSESKSFHDTRKLCKFANVLKKAADYILKAEKVISAAAQPCLPASIACAGVMLVLSVSFSMRLHMPDADAQIALCSSRQSAGRSLQRPG